MTHTSNVTIPSTFRFRPKLGRWFIVSATTVDWYEKPTSPYPLLVKPLPMPWDEGEWINVSIPRLSSSPATTRMLLGLYSQPDSQNYLVKMRREELPTEVIARHENKRTAPDISDRSFPVLLSEQPESASSFAVKKPDGAVKNAWAMRDEFLNLEHDPSKLRMFLDRWGSWRPRFAHRMSDPSTLNDSLLILPHDIWRLQELYRRALTGSARNWLRSVGGLGLVQSDVPPYFSIEVSDCESAIRGTITIDHLSNSTFGICRRSDCRRLFEFTTKQRRYYCTPHCAHVATVRKSRAEKKKAAASTQRRRTNGKG
jgi:hypothetical protein